MLASDLFVLALLTIIYVLVFAAAILYLLYFYNDRNGRR
jgi:hypothetical protein